MKLLRDLASVMSRMPVGAQVPPLNSASMVQASGMSQAASALDQVLGPLSTSRGTVRTDAEAVAAPAGAEHVAVVHPFPVQPGVAQTGDSAGTPTIYRHAGGKASVVRPGQQNASWRNPYVAYAMPALLHVQRALAHGKVDHLAMRAQLALEVRLFRERLGKKVSDWTLLDDASYLLCTFLDELTSDHARAQSVAPYGGERSLLVEFHGDAWGGEDAFAKLEQRMDDAKPALDLLMLYELLMSLGWQGRYRVRDRGDVLLQDLRARLNAMLWHQQGPASLGATFAVLAPWRKRWLTATRASLMLLVAAGAVWAAAALDLDSRSRPLREALASWTPPVRTINLAETLPPPLPQLLAEGWLTAEKHPQGWLLIFKSDGAFDVGKAQFRPEFLNNVERLGQAFAPWPGDLEVIGHTDSQPIRHSKFASNQALSEARAEAVATELRQTALPGGARVVGKVVPRQVSGVGVGDSRPRDSAQTDAALARNRRVDVLWKVIPEGRVAPVAQPEVRP
jgi:type VI secretion system protein ImpK